MTSKTKKNKILIKKIGGVRAFRHQGHVWRGVGVVVGWEGDGRYWQWWRRECITGSCVLYERDREGFRETEVTWKRDSQSEREASQPLESKLRLTPLYSPLFSIWKYSTSSKESVLLLFDVILFIYYWGRECWGGKHLWFTTVTQQLIDVWGEVQQKLFSSVLPRVQICSVILMLILCLWFLRWTSTKEIQYHYII